MKTFNYYLQFHGESPWIFAYFSNAINYKKNGCMASKLKVKTIRLNPSLLKTIEELSKNENRSFNNTVETLLLRATGSLK